MNAVAITHSATGERRIPETLEDWQYWVAATGTRNHAEANALIDWLDLYGQALGFRRDNEYPDYDPRSDFSQFILRKGIEFEASIARLLEKQIPMTRGVVNGENSRDLAAAQRTFALMQEGAPAIYQAALRDAESQTYGTADLLIRSDYLRKLFPAALLEAEAFHSAPDLGGQPWHYRVIDFKFTTLHFLAGGGLSDSDGSAWAYMLQTFIYNRALGRLQGYLPPCGYLLGRGWEQTVKGDKRRGSTCLERLASVLQAYVSRTKGPLADAVEAACAWARRVRREGGDWQVLPEPSVPELRPNMTTTTDQPWHHAKQTIGYSLEDLTLLWWVGAEKRNQANDKGIYRWSDPRCVAEMVGVTGERTRPTLNAILQVNRHRSGPTILPERVTASAEVWRQPGLLEFFVDFETVSDLDDDFSRLPQKGGLPLICMIGCGHTVEGNWRWSSFIADDLSLASEGRIIEAWLSHMGEVKWKLGLADEAQPLVFHWSQAEVSTFDTAFNSAKQRHPGNQWPAPNWFDFLQKVIRAEPVVVRGAFGFGLKAVAKALTDLGKIKVEWDSGPGDGLGAMVGAWWCAAEARKLGCKLGEVELMQSIARYNEIDCRAMWEIVNLLRLER